MIVYFDGGCSPNPGEMSIGLVVKSPTGQLEPMRLDRLGYGTNNIAEWSALLWASTIAREREFTNPVFIGDSQLVVNQALGKWKVRNPNLVCFEKQFRDLMVGCEFSLKQVPRSRNLAGIFLERGRL